MIMQNVLGWYHIDKVPPPKNKQVLVTNDVHVWAATYRTDDIQFWDRPETEGWVIFECEDYYYTYHLLDEKMTQWAEMPVVLGR